MFIRKNKIHLLTEIICFCNFRPREKKLLITTSNLFIIDPFWNKHVTHVSESLLIQGVLKFLKIYKQHTLTSKYCALLLCNILKKNFKGRLGHYCKIN